jgi:chromate transporter
VLAQLFTGFAQVSLFMFGGGYAAVPLFHELAVQRHGWVDARTLADAIALSQLTPGPIMTSAGFIGQQAAGWAGNLAALAGMFLPMALIAVLLTRAMGGCRQVWWMQGVLAGARPAALGVITATGLLLAARLDALWAWAACGAALFLLLRWRLPSYWLVPGAAVAGAGWYLLAGA